MHVTCAGYVPHEPGCCSAGGGTLTSVCRYHLGQPYVEVFLYSMHVTCAGYVPHEPGCCSAGGGTLTSVCRYHLGTAPCRGFPV